MIRFVTTLLLLCGMPVIIGQSTLATTFLTTKPSSSSADDNFTTISISNDDCAAKNNKCRRLPDALIIGAKKAGTRAVLEFIRLHPDVRAAGKEIHFFDRDFSFGVDYYKNEMPPASPHQIVVEKTPAYLTDPSAPKRIMATLGAYVKLILIVRNPVERLLSDYAQSLYKVKQEIKQNQRTGKPATITTFLKPFSELAFIKTAKDNTTKPIVNLNYNSLQVGLYAKHLARFIEAGFSLRKNIYIVNGDKLPHNPGPEMVRLQQFLKLTPMIGASNFYFDEDKGFSCVKEPVVLKNGTSSFKVRRRRRRCLGPSKGGRQREHPKLTSDEREALVRFYAPYNELFFQLVSKAGVISDKDEFNSWQCYSSNYDSKTEPAICV